MNDLTRNILRLVEILIVLVQNVEVSMFLLGPGRNQNINVNIVTTNLIILKTSLNIKQLDKKEALTDNIIFLRTKYSRISFYTFKIFFKTCMSLFDEFPIIFLKKNQYSFKRKNY
jgi:hypothetical protein